MAQALSMAMRHRIIELRKSGKSLMSISQILGVSYVSVQTLCKRYKTAGESGLKPRYDRCGRVRPDVSNFIYRAVRCMRSWHPSWGAEKIRAEMLLMRPDLQLPQVRTFQNWFHWNGQAKKRSKLPTEAKRWARTVHEGWQIDAKEEIKARDGKKTAGST